MIELNKKGKVKIKWKVNPYDYSPEKAKEIITYFAQKYGVHKDNVKVSADFIMVNENGAETSITNDVIDNIQDPIFQEKLFREYIKIYNIENCDYDIITSIDKELNRKIDYQVYDKFRKFSIKWIRFSNFQSYGTDNYFDFSTLNGLVLLNGEPANQSGKTTFAVDLLHFLLFGKTAKAKTQDEIFNRYLPSETHVTVEGCITIEGEEYVIKRTLSRPKLEKRTPKSKTTQKVEYYKVIGERLEELDDCLEVESENGADNHQTNKIIKEAIGREEDFDLIMCITGKNLDSLIDEKPTDRGRLFSRWIGLLPLEEKEALAKDKFNNSIKPSLVTTQYNREVLKQEIEAYKVAIEEEKTDGKKYKEILKALDDEITSLESDIKTLVESKENIDTNVLKIDISTLLASIQAKKDSGITKKAEYDKKTEEIADIGEVDFSVEEYDGLNEKRTKLLLQQQQKRSDAKRLMELINQLKTSEYCPTCKRKLDNVDNTEQINENQKELDKLIAEGKQTNEEIILIDSKIASMKDNREKYTRLNSLKSQLPIIELNLERLRNEYKELVQQHNEYKKNADAIDKNNNINLVIRNTEANIKTKRGVRENNFKLMLNCKQNIETYEKEIKRREELIEKIKQEEKLIYNWKIYLEMVGKNGISKMVMRKTLPIINARLTQLLDGVCDFDVNIVINNRNEVAFNLIKNGVVSDLNSGSGFEKTASALALRSVLADVSTIPRLNFLVLDEILGRVSSENYDKMNLLYDRISKGFSFIFHISHVDAIKDWHNHIVTVTKDETGVSRLKQKENKKEKTNK